MHKSLCFIFSPGTEPRVIEWVLKRLGMGTGLVKMVDTSHLFPPHKETVK